MTPAGRHRATTTNENNTAATATTISHYDGHGSTPAWTITGAGVTTRNITGIGGGIAAIETGGKEPTLQISNLHGDIVGTAPDNSEATQPKLTSEPTAFGVPTSAENSSHSWLGSGGLQIEFTSGVASTGGGAYIPQVGLYLEPQALTQHTGQDPINEYLANQTKAQPVAEWNGTSPGAIMPLPVNTKIAEEYADGVEVTIGDPIKCRLHGRVDENRGTLTGEGWANCNGAIPANFELQVCLQTGFPGEVRTFRKCGDTTHTGPSDYAQVGSTNGPKLECSDEEVYVLKARLWARGEKHPQYYESAEFECDNPSEGIVEVVLGLPGVQPSPPGP